MLTGLILLLTGCSPLTVIVWLIYVSIQDNHEKLEAKEKRRNY